VKVSHFHPLLPKARERVVCGKHWLRKDSHSPLWTEGLKSFCLYFVHPPGKKNERFQRVIYSFACSVTGIVLFSKQEKKYNSLHRNGKKSEENKKSREKA